MEKIKIGQIVNTVGLRGEMKVYSYAESPDRFEKLSKIFLENEEYRIETVRYKNKMPIIKVVGIDSLDVAESHKSVYVYMAQEDLEPLSPGEYYIKDLLGSQVVDEKGNPIGILEDISTATTQKLYKIKREDGRPVYIPGVSQFILEKNPEEKRITVRLPKGLLEL